MFYQKGSF